MAVTMLSEDIGNAVDGSAERTMPFQDSSVQKTVHPLIVLVDGYAFSRDCLARLLAERLPGARILPVTGARDPALQECSGIAVMLYMAHDSRLNERAVLEDLSGLNEAAPDVPVVLVTEDNLGSGAVRAALVERRVRGLLSARNTSASMAVAALNLVIAGGSYVAEDLLPGETDEARARDVFTSRQNEVLHELRQGKPNKIIAFELGMSESTVKVHVRNIMRKLGATNRTQVLVKADERRRREATQSS
jgi:DNA-binding NarL/FixJ family response regulator